MISVPRYVGRVSARSRLFTHVVQCARCRRRQIECVARVDGRDGGVSQSCVACSASHARCVVESESESDSETHRERVRAVVGQLTGILEEQEQMRAEVDQARELVEQRTRELLALEESLRAAAARRASGS